jgi:hypothetical protein
MATSVTVPLVVYTVDMWVASQGRGGTFALVIACVVAVSTTVLWWTAACGAPSTAHAIQLCLAHLIASGGAIGYAGLRLAALRHSDSNLLGGWALIFGPLLWLGVLAATILVLPCVLTRIARL